MKSSRSRTEAVVALTIAALMVVSATVMIADNSTIVYSSPTHAVVVTRDGSGDLTIAIDQAQVYQDGTYIGVSQNGKFILRVRMIELIRDLPADQRAGNDLGFADPVKLQTEYTKTEFSGSTMADGLPVFIRILTDEHGNFLLITTTSVPVQTDKELHPVTSNL